MSATAARGMPLCLQYIYTNLACARFARALLDHPSAKGARVVDIWTKDPRRLEEDETTSFIHTALQMPDGRLLDAEGIRTFPELCADFDMRPDLSSVEDGLHPTADTNSPEGALIRRLADALGWKDGAPLASAVETASGSWQEAAADFEARGGMNSKPVLVLASCIEEAEEAIPGLTKLRRAAEEMDWVPTRAAGPRQKPADCDQELRAGGQVLARVVRDATTSLWAWSASIPLAAKAMPQASGGPLDAPYDAMDEAQEWVEAALLDLTIPISDTTAGPVPGP